MMTIPQKITIHPQIGGAEVKPILAKPRFWEYLLPQPLT